MTISGTEKCSLVDWPGMMTAVVFVPGCNMNCFYCHNRPLLRGGAVAPLDLDNILDWLRQRIGLLDGVVVSGGEPTLQPGLVEFIQQVRDIGFRVKLDTNGARPAVLAALLFGGLVDYVAMDIKAPRAKYHRVTGVPMHLDLIDASIHLLRASSIDYEFRTTAIPQLTHDDIVSIAEWVQGARRLTLQQYRRPEWATARDDARILAPPHDAAWFRAAIARIKGLVGSCGMRGLGELVDAEERCA